MQKKTACALVLITLFFSAFRAYAKTIEVRLQIEFKPEEKTITRENLIAIQQFILKQGQRETYCNKYNDNPAYRTKNYHFYLNPDTGQENINCDPKKSEFHNLTIRRVDGGKNQSRTVGFLDEHVVYLAASWPTDDLTVQQIRQFVVEATEELLAEIKEKEPNKLEAGDSKNSRERAHQHP